MRICFRIIVFIIGILIASVALAQTPTTTKPNLSTTVAPCASNSPILGGGAGAPPGCSPGALVLGSGKTATINNTVTINATDGSTLNAGAGGSITYNPVTSVSCGSGLSGGTITATGTCALYFDPGSLTNCTLSGTVSGNALTVSLLNQAGSAPTASSPCVVSFRNATVATGDYTAVLVTAATTFSTGTSGSTFGSSNATPFRLWITAWNNGGTVALGVSSQSTGTDVFFIDESTPQSSTACSACTTATAAGTYYTTAAQTSKAIRIIGYMDWASGLTTAGTYATGPTTIQMFGPGIKKPGESTGRISQGIFTAVGNSSSATIIASPMTKSISLSAAPNLVRVNVIATARGGTATANSALQWYLYRGAAACTTQAGPSGFVGNSSTIVSYSTVGFSYLDKPGAAGSQGYTVCFNLQSAGSGTVSFPATDLPTNNYMSLEEIMGELPEFTNDNINPGVYSQTG